jgi:hypothetical protein
MNPEFESCYEMDSKKQCQSQSHSDFPTVEMLMENVTEHDLVFFNNVNIKEEILKEKVDLTQYLHTPTLYTPTYNGYTIDEIKIKLDELKNIREQNLKFKKSRVINKSIMRRNDIQYGQFQTFFITVWEKLNGKLSFNGLIEEHSNIKDDLWKIFKNE